MKKILFVSVVGMVLTACVNVQAVKSLSVEDARNSDPINGATAGCSSFGVSKDCNIISGATRVVSIEGSKMRIAGSEDGRTVMIMHDSDECGITETDCQTKVNNRNYAAIKKYYSSIGVSISSVRAIAAADFIGGYSLTLDNDGYSVLEKL
ncbi:hypothetical protein ACJJI5_07395 [Microbulbifer sp. EKSA008]|uniref:hypothetical protein n=1 Tax=unclassified Microbulbifer TaxID=2619833 RepID=UPI004042139D